MEEIVERDIKRYSPFVLPVNIIPMYFQLNLEKKTLVAKIRVYLLDSIFNGYKGSFELLDDELAFSGSLYESLLTGEFSGHITLICQKAKELAKFDNFDFLRQITIDSENTQIEVKGERIIAGSTELLADPTAIFGTAQGKFERLVEENKDLVGTYYFFMLKLFAKKESPKQAFYQAVLANLS